MRITALNLTEALREVRESTVTTIPAASDAYMIPKKASERRKKVTKTQTPDCDEQSDE